MKLLDWLRDRQSKPSTGVGEHLGAVIEDTVKHEARKGLPLQREAKLIDFEGNMSSHKLDLNRDGTPLKEVIVVVHSNVDRPEQNIYEYRHEQHGCLIYHQVYDDA